MKRPYWLIVMILAALGWSCSEPMRYTGDTDDPVENFEALAKIVGERYCFFRQKGINWDSIVAVYRQKVTPKTGYADLFFICGDMLDELKDGHVNLASPFATTYYKKWWTDYPQDFNDRTLQEYYLKFGGLKIGSLQYCIFLPDTIGYLRIPNFNSEIGAGTLDNILALLGDTKGLVIDIRDNGGGYLTNVREIVSRFIDKKIVGGYIRHKTGPGPDDFSEPYTLVYEPAEKGRVQYLHKPVMVLTNRSCYSAANDLVSVMKRLPEVKIVGATTGGGGGLPFSSELPNGWGVRLSACPINDADDRMTEWGIAPSPGCEVHCTAEELAEGKDAILNFALQALK